MDRSIRASPPPHVPRLLRRVRTLETPVVQVWGWPGSGKAALLEALLESEGERAAALTLADLGSEAGLRQAIDHAGLGGARWLVAGACPAERLAAVARWLKPGQRLVFTTPWRQPAGPLDCGVVGPEELLLERREVGALIRLALGAEPAAPFDPESVRRLHEASDGWYRPLRLALEEDAAAAAAARGAEDLIEIRAVRSFLRHEALGSFSAEARELLLAEPLAAVAERRRGGDREARRAALLEERGMLLEDGAARRPPRLLAAFLARAGSRPARRPAAAPVALPARPGYTLRLLGEPTVSPRQGQGEGPPIVWRLKRSFKVLAYLASSPGLSASREEIVEALWPDEDEERIQKNFHPTLSHLRRALESGAAEEPAPLVLRDGIYRLSPEIDWTIDLLELGRLVEEGRRLVRDEPERAATVWRQAWGLYRGPFLQGHSEAWISTRRESHQRTYLELLRELGDLLVHLERWSEAMDAYRAVLVEDPLQERIHVAVMRLYSREGRRDLVRRQYDRLQNLLIDELGVTPLAETTHEYHQLMG